MADPSLKTLDQAPWRNDPAIETLFNALLKAGDEVRVVGGAIRNHLSNRPVSDIDFATTLLPEEVIKRAESAGLKTIATGLEHGTVTIVIADQSFEVTTLRRDIKTDGRRAEVVFGTDWREDALRRDFTINALYADQNGKLYDPLGQGIEDLSPLKIRFIGDAGERIKEDYLRILRFYRFNAAYDTEQFDETAIKATITYRAGLKTLSPERVKSELFKLLKAPHAAETLHVMYRAGLLVSVLASVPKLSAFEKLCAIEAHLEREPSAILRFAALALWSASDIKRLTDNFRLSNKEASVLKSAVRSLSWPKDQSQQSLKALHYKEGKDAFLTMFLYQWAMSQSPVRDNSNKTLFENAQNWELPIFPLSGEDLTAEGLTPGPEFGKILKDLEREWLSSEMSLTKPQLIALLKQKHCS